MHNYDTKNAHSGTEISQGVASTRCNPSSGHTSQTGYDSFNCTITYEGDGERIDNHVISKWVIVTNPTGPGYIFDPDEIVNKNVQDEGYYRSNHALPNFDPYEKAEAVNPIEADVASSSNENVFDDEKYEKLLPNIDSEGAQGPPAVPDEVVDKIGQKANNPVSDVHRVFVYINPNGYNKPTNTENARNPFNVKKIQKLMNDILIASGSDTRMTLIETTNAKDMFDLGFQQTWKGTEYFDHYVEFSDQMLSETGLPVRRGIERRRACRVTPC